MKEGRQTSSSEQSEEYVRGKRQFRRTRIVGFATLGACALTIFATGSSASGDPAIQPGRGMALGEIVKLDPRAGSLSLGITNGRSIAGHQNTVAQASSQAFDYGIIGSTMASPGCDGSAPTLPADKQPAPMQVDSRQPNATADADEDKVPVPAHKHASATPAPYGEAITTSAAQTLGPIVVGGGVTTAHSGLLDDGKVREASATVDISGIEIPPAGISLSGLHWEATWRSSDPQSVGTFTIGSATIQGQSVPTNDPSAVLTQVNTALAPLGIALKAPAARPGTDMIAVDPLTFSIFPSATRDGAVNTVLGNPSVSQARQDLFAALLAQDCGNATYITVFDLVMGSITGAGSFNVLLGGVQASSGEAYQNSFCLGCGSGSPLLSVSPGSPGFSTAGSVGPPSVGGASAPSNATPGPAAATAAPAAPVRASFLGKRGGALAGVGLAGLGLMALAAEGDRRKMRRAQREIPQFQE